MSVSEERIKWASPVVWSVREIRCYRYSIEVSASQSLLLSVSPHQRQHELCSLPNNGARSDSVQTDVGWVRSSEAS